MDSRPNRTNKAAFSNFSGVVTVWTARPPPGWTGPWSVFYTEDALLKQIDHLKKMIKSTLSINFFSRKCVKFRTNSHTQLLQSRSITRLNFVFQSLFQVWRLRIIRPSLLDTGQSFRSKVKWNNVFFGLELRYNCY